MFFGFTADQLAFRDTVREVLARECGAEVVRAAGTDVSLDRRAWKALAGLGLLGLLVPEEAGGLGLDEAWLALPLEEAGYAGLPHPLVETAAVAMPLVHGLVREDAMISTDLGGRYGGGSPDAPGGLVPAAADADAVLIGLALAHEVIVEPVATVDRGRRVGVVHAEQLKPVEGDLGLALDRGAWGTAAFLIGLSRRMIDMTVRYVSERQQFGSHIGSFQAVQHHLADAALGLEFARPLVYRAAWSLASDDPDRSRDVSMAKAMASDCAMTVSRLALQCHGAMGYTREYDLHLFMARAWALARAWGDSRWHRDRVGRALGI